MLVEHRIDRVLRRGARAELALVSVLLEDAVDLFVREDPDAANWLFGAPLRGAEHSISYRTDPTRLDLFYFDGSFCTTIFEPRRTLDVIGTPNQCGGFDLSDICDYLGTTPRVVRAAALRQYANRADDGQTNFFFDFRSRTIEMEDEQ
jgi:hypothetical protein